MRPWIWIAAAALTLPSLAFAGAVQDGDGDLVPTQFDSCSTVANGPNQSSNQVDCDFDGYGNRCDTDLNQDCATTAADFGLWLSHFGQNVGAGLCSLDFDGNGNIGVTDFALFLSKFGNPPGAPGPSGLVCARCTLRVDLGDAPCTP